MKRCVSPALWALALAGSVQGGVITFTDFTVDAGLTAPRRGINCALGDIEPDGDLDIIVWNAANIDDLLYRNDGTAHFEDISVESGIEGTIEGGGEFGGPFADFDNDGDPDVYVPTISTSPNIIDNAFFRNLSGGSFEEVAEELGVLNSIDTIGPAWADIERDGDLDFYVGALPRGGVNRPLLYVNESGVLFEDQWGARGMTFQGNGQSHLWFDWEEDGDPDLYVGASISFASPELQRDFLYRNDGTGHFEMVTDAFDASPEFTGSVALADFDGDLRLDILAIGIGDSDPVGFGLNWVWRDNGDGTFTDIAPQLNLTMPPRVVFNQPDLKTSAIVADFDNDMDPDVFVSQGTLLLGSTPRDLLWLNEGGVYVERGTEAGIDDPFDSWQSSAGDLNGDGFLDIYVVNDNDFGSRDTLWLNNGNANHWLEIDPQGVVSNRDGIGLRAWVTAGGVTQVQELYSTTSLPNILHFGLASNEIVESLTLRWPNGLLESYWDLPADQVFRPVEGAATPFEGTGVTLR